MTQSIHTTLLSIVPLRKEPSDKSEMTSQILYGEPLQILDTQEKWVMIRNLEDNYEGWADRKQIVELPEESRRMIVSPMCALTNAKGQHIWLPSGAQIAPSHAEVQIGGASYATPGNEAFTRPEIITDYARQFLGTPYLWGGRTVAGIDCSGFTQIVLKVFGNQLPRDAYQQAECGETISFVEESRNGDLAFFDNADGRIVHVGVISKVADKTHIIHASGMVREDLLDHNGIYHAGLGTYTHQLRIIKRII
jgi:hypothetical protein